MNKLLAIESIRNISYLKGLRKLYDECEIQIRSLNSLNVTSGSYGNLLCPIILQKISEELNLEFNRYRKNDTEFQIEELMDFLKREVNCREAANFVNKNNQNVKNFRSKSRVEDIILIIEINLLVQRLHYQQ
ncbi:integrase catalytic domain-containing protein [Trichonephila clavata]|uniref:Integrase catalytic domain-containing protein n=1 Tax=Trichonephila clavata TaxID=2740835 RepID=A0A8X6GR18_TRICU|nr:integrase catalytic domain-containing protein [Trichonephila clavata]